MNRAVGAPSSRNDDVTWAAHQWRARLQDSSLSNEERDAFAAWMRADIRHEEAFDRAETIWHAFDTLEPDLVADDLMQPSFREHFVRFQRGLKIDAITHSKPRIAGLFAMLVACLALALWLPTPPGPSPRVEQISTFRSGNGETRAIALKDGSQVTLGPETLMQVEFSDTFRRVTLSTGAALFDIASDEERPFTVTSGDMSAKALGTRFDVRRNGGVSRVAVSEGVVRVSYPFLSGGARLPMKLRATLHTGEQVAATTKAGLRDVQPISPDQVGAWQNAQLIYESATLAELVADANRYYAADIALASDVEDIAQETITASFRGDDIDRMLELLTLSFPVVIDRSAPGRVVLRSKGTP